VELKNESLDLKDIKSYLDLMLGTIAKEFGSISLDAIYLLAKMQLQNKVLNLEEVKIRTKASSELIIQWIREGRLHVISYPENDEPLFDKDDVDRVIQHYSTSNNEFAIKQIIKFEREARKKHG
jgi:hypothetical protein